MDRINKTINTYPKDKVSISSISKVNKQKKKKLIITDRKTRLKQKALVSRNLNILIPNTRNLR
jgi:hypothetical protein